MKSHSEGSLGFKVSGKREPSPVSSVHSSTTYTEIRVWAQHHLVRSR